MRHVLIGLALMAAPAAAQIPEGQPPAPQLQARYEALLAREAGGHAMAAYERRWVEAYLAGAPEATAPWQWVYTQRALVEQLHRNGGSHFETYYETWTVTDDRDVAPADWVVVGQACGRAWFGSPLMGRMGQASSNTQTMEITIDGPGGAQCHEAFDTVGRTDLFPSLAD